MRLLLVGITLVLVVGCEGDQEERITDPDGAFSFAFDQPGNSTTVDDKVRWDGPGVTATLQRVTPVAGYEGSLAEAANALAERYDAGEVDGELAVSPCRLAERALYCTRGHVVVDGRRVERRGFLVQEQGTSVLMMVELLADSDANALLNDAELRARNTWQWGVGTES